MPSLAPEKLSPAQRVTSAIEAALQRGVRPWVKPWSDTLAAGPLLMPRRANGIAYRGINVVALWAAAAEAGFASPTWYTFKQAQAHGGQVRKGERGAFAVVGVSYAAPPSINAQMSSARHTVMRGPSFTCLG